MYSMVDDRFVSLDFYYIVYMTSLSVKIPNGAARYFFVGVVNAGVVPGSPRPE